MAIPAAVPLITAGINVIGSIFSSNAAIKQRNRAKRQERRARREMDRLKAVYANLIKDQQLNKLVEYKHQKDKVKFYLDK